MATNVADEIRTAEEKARDILKDARSEAATILSGAKADAERRIKETKQQCHKSFVKQLREIEGEAEAKATDTVQSGKEESEAFLKQAQPNVDGVSRWIAEEVMTRYGRESN